MEYPNANDEGNPSMKLQNANFSDSQHRKERLKRKRKEDNRKPQPNKTTKKEESHNQTKQQKKTENNQKPRWKTKNKKKQTRSHSPKKKHTPKKKTSASIPMRLCSTKSLLLATECLPSGGRIRTSVWGPLTRASKRKPKRRLRKCFFLLIPSII